MPMLTYHALQHVQIGAPQAPNAQARAQYPQTTHVAQTVPPDFSYPPQMWFTSNMPAWIALETSRPASQVAPPAFDPARPALSALARQNKGHRGFLRLWHKCSRPLLGPEHGTTLEIQGA